MMRKITIPIFCLLFFCQASVAQDFFFSQYHYTPFLTNPALLGSQNWQSLWLNYRHQPLPDGENIQTVALSGMQPMFGRSGRRWGGLGLSLFQDRAANFVNSFGSLAAASYNVTVGSSQISLGIQAGYFQKRIDAQGLSTLAQYQNGAFDPTLPNGEPLLSARAGYFNASAGALWYKEETQTGEYRYYLGVSGMNLTNPQLNFTGISESKVPLLYHVIGGLNLLPTTSNWILMPNTRFSSFSGFSFANVGSWLRYKTAEKSSVGMGLWYNTNRALIASAELKLPSFVVALSYDLSIGDNTVVWQRNGSLEVTFGLRKWLDVKPKDSDGDGVPDKDDLCPQAAGKPQLQGCPDKDDDGIADKDDDCPEQKGIADFKGCPDTDSDGIPDKEDECPQTAGLPQFKGCPDTDSDGIPDKEDECPQTAGLPQFKGCPDSDGDGIPDKEDECPQTAGLLQFKGCPDSDGDGIADPYDQCPDEPGVPALKGCPEVITIEEEKLLQKAAYVQFKSGEAVILRNSFAILNEVAELLKNHPNGKMELIGHTDNTGSETKNQLLSEQRAAAVKEYLVSKGIDENRISTSGKGSSEPVAPNNTAEGKSKNRRVEMKFEAKVKK